MLSAEKKQQGDIRRTIQVHIHSEQGDRRDLEKTRERACESTLQPKLPSRIGKLRHQDLKPKKNHGLLPDDGTMSEAEEVI